MQKCVLAQARDFIVTKRSDKKLQIILQYFTNQFYEDVCVPENIVLQKSKPKRVSRAINIDKIRVINFIIVFSNEIFHIVFSAKCEKSAMFTRLNLICLRGYVQNMCIPVDQYFENKSILND